MSAILSLFAAAALAQYPAPPTAHALYEKFIETVDAGAKAKVLEDLARTPATNSADVQGLYDMYMRFPDERVRRAALGSLQLMSPAAVSAEPLITRCLGDSELDSVLFGLKGALRLRSASLLPLVKKIAGRKFRHQTPADAAAVTERNAWWVQYEAVAVLAQWQGPEALPLARRKAAEAAGVARVLGQHYWEETLSDSLEWTRGDARERARAYEALDAPAPLPALRNTRETMMKFVADRAADAEARHKLALKIGASSKPEEVPALLAAHEAAADEYTKKIWAAAAFATHDPQIVPLLTRYAKENAEPLVRLGARIQLKDMLPPSEYRALLEWAAKSESDPQNRELAEKELKL